MFDNLKTGDEVSAFADISKEETPSAPPAENTTEDKDSNGSEADKNTEDKSNEEGKPFHEHSRFKELISEKNELKSMLEEKSSQLDSVQNQLAEMQQVVDKLNKPNEEAPQFETLEELSAYLKELPNKLKEQIISDFEKKQTEKENAKMSDEKNVQAKLDKISEKEKSFDKDSQKKFLKWIVEEELTELPLEKAFKFYQKVSAPKDNGADIDKRKAQSGLSKSNLTVDKPNFEYNPRQSMDDIIREAKANLKT